MASAVSLVPAFSTAKPFCPFRTQSGPSSRASLNCGLRVAWASGHPFQNVPSVPREGHHAPRPPALGCCSVQCVTILFCICRPGDGTQTRDQNGGSVTASCRACEMELQLPPRRLSFHTLPCAWGSYQRWSNIESGGDIFKNKIQQPAARGGRGPTKHFCYFNWGAVAPPPAPK